MKQMRNLSSLNEVARAVDIDVVLVETPFVDLGEDNFFFSHEQHLTTALACFERIKTLVYLLLHCLRFSLPYQVLQFTTQYEISPTVLNHSATIVPFCRSISNSLS